MPIDIYEHYRPKINAIAREQGIPEEIIEPKSIKYGTRYDFPQNMSWELEENSVMMFNKFRVYMEEKYEEAITQAIADEAEYELCIVDNDVFPVSVQKQHFCSRGAKADKEE